VGDPKQVAGSVAMIERAAAWLVAVALCSTPVSVGAQVGSTLTGEDYLDLCTTTNLGWQPESNVQRDVAIFCAGYIRAAITLIVSMDKQLFCLPKGMTPGEVIKTTVAFMQAHPDQKELPLANTMVAAVRDRWPCGSK
jgi:hypothetical protein